jgi:activator of HSP90 ATPase
MCKTIKLKVRFPAPPDEIYRLLVDARTQGAYTAEKTSIDARPGGSFSAFGGRISGINVELVPGKRLVQAWRERRFPEGVYSMATFNLAKTPRGGTELVLTHRGVPKDLIPRITSEWRRRYWDPMKDYLERRD